MQCYKYIYMIRYKSCNTIPLHTMQYHIIQCNIMQYNAIPYHTTQNYAIPCNTTWCALIPLIANFFLYRYLSQFSFVWVKSESKQISLLVYSFPMLVLIPEDVQVRAGKSKSLIRCKRLTGRIRRIWFTIRLLAKKYLLSGDVLNPMSEVLPSHNNCFQKL